ncbi:MAG: hypothetical protein EOP35_07005, partial [Rubrivivax sp.]
GGGAGRRGCLHQRALRRLAQAPGAPLIASNLRASRAGINLEDGSDAPALLARKIEAIKAAAARAGVDVFINARCDVWLRRLAPGREVEEVLLRARDYLAAGADGLFAAGVTAVGDIEALVAGQPLPLNVMARPALPGLSELQRLGVRRISAGSAIAEAAWGRSRQAAEGFLAAGAGAGLFDGATPYPQINAGFSQG